MALIFHSLDRSGFLDQAESQKIICKTKVPPSSELHLIFFFHCNRPCCFLFKIFFFLSSLYCKRPALTAGEEWASFRTCCLKRPEASVHPKPCPLGKVLKLEEIFTALLPCSCLQNLNYNNTHLEVHVHHCFSCLVSPFYPEETHWMLAYQLICKWKTI